jgi:hypothetical protein
MVFNAALVIRPPGIGLMVFNAALVIRSSGLWCLTQHGSSVHKGLGLWGEGIKFNLVVPAQPFT